MHNIVKSKKICLGSANFDMIYGIGNKKKLPFSDVKKIIHYSSTIGVNTIDTAISYGGSEKILGKLKIDNFNIITKLPKIPNKCSNIEKWVFNSINRSIKNLKVKKLYSVLIHNEFDLINSKAEFLHKALYKLKKAKVISNIGVSIYDFKNIDKIIKNFKIDIVQLPFNLIDRRLINLGYLKKLKKKKIKIFVRSIFLQGLLLTDNKYREKKFKRWENIWIKFDNWLKKNKVSQLKVCTDFIFKFHEIDRVIVGVNNLSQLKEINDNLKKKKILNFPNINSKDLKLINPQNWKI